MKFLKSYIDPRIRKNSFMTVMRMMMRLKQVENFKDPRWAQRIRWNSLMRPKYHEVAPLWANFSFSFKYRRYWTRRWRWWRYWRIEIINIESNLHLPIFSPFQVELKLVSPELVCKWPGADLVSLICVLLIDNNWHLWDHCQAMHW